MFMMQSSLARGAEARAECWIGAQYKTFFPAHNWNHKKPAESSPANGGRAAARGEMPAKMNARAAPGNFA
jgi:hypothetical protein